MVFPSYPVIIMRARNFWSKRMADKYRPEGPEVLYHYIVCVIGPSFEYLDFAPQSAHKPATMLTTGSGQLLFFLSILCIGVSVSLSLCIIVLGDSGYSCWGGCGLTMPMWDMTCLDVSSSLQSLAYLGFSAAISLVQNAEMALVRACSWLKSDLDMSGSAWTEVQPHFFLEMSLGLKKLCRRLGIAISVFSLNNWVWECDLNMNL